MSIIPIDLRSLPAAAGFRLVDEVTGRKATSRTDAWEVVARGRRGEIGPYDDTRLLVSTNTANCTRQILLAVPGAEVTQHATDGDNLIVPVEAFEAVAAIIRPRRKRTRVLTDEQRAELAERMRTVRQKRAA